MGVVSRDEARNLSVRRDPCRRAGVPDSAAFLGRYLVDLVVDRNRFTGGCSYSGCWARSEWRTALDSTGDREFTTL